MVTIEQKLTLFSNLLHRTMDEAFKAEMEKLKKEYDIKIQKNKEEVDREAEIIISAAEKKALAECAERISRNKVEFKKEYMLKKEHYFSILMGRIKKELDAFVRSEQYPGYLLELAGKLEPVQTAEILEIYLTDRDSEKYLEQIKNTLLQKGKWKELVFLPAAADDIIGGLIAEDPQSNIRIDLSLKAMLEDNRSFIMQTLFQAIETGD